MAKKVKELTARDYYEKGMEALRDWKDIYENGCTDPFWPDGVNLNLVRNHIRYYNGMIQDVCGQDIQMSLFDAPTVDLVPVPEEMSCDYIAHESEILENARAQLIEVMETPAYRYLADTAMETNADLTRDGRVEYFYISRLWDVAKQEQPTAEQIIELRRFIHGKEAIRGEELLRTIYKIFVAKAGVQTPKNDCGDRKPTSNKKAEWYRYSLDSPLGNAIREAANQDALQELERDFLANPSKYPWDVIAPQYLAG